MPVNRPLVPVSTCWSSSSPSDVGEVGAQGLIQPREPRPVFAGEEEAPLNPRRAQDGGGEGRRAVGPAPRPWRECRERRTCSKDGIHPARQTGTVGWGMPRNATAPSGKTAGMISLCVAPMLPAR